MPSQEEYLDNLLKGIENTEDEKENAVQPEEAESSEESMPQLDMSDMDELLQSALAAQDSPTENTSIHPEETTSMSEDEINELLQKSQEQAENVPQPENADSNDELIRMLENTDDEGLSSILDQVTPNAVPEGNVEEATDENDRGHGKKKKRDKKKDKKPGFFGRFKKKSKEQPEQINNETDGESIPGEGKMSGITTEEPETVPEVISETEPTENEGTIADEAAQNAEQTVADDTTGVMDDDLDALLAGAFPEKTADAADIPESADVMDILKAAGADIVEEPDKKKEKKGLLAKLLDLFTEEDEDEEEADQIHLSDENKKILEEVDKNKKTKGKKQKKAKKEKQPKAKKAEKKKKEKPVKDEKPAVPEKKLSPKKVLPIMVVCFSLGAVILLLGDFLTEYMARRSGRQAYYAGDYQTCYQDLFGKELNETEQIMYSKSESILTIRMWLREYDVFVNEGSELEALDSLLQAVHDYPSLLTYATEWNAQDEVTAAFQNILNILEQKYQLSQEEAQTIANISDNVEYTRNVMEVLQELGLESWDFPQGGAMDKTPEQNTAETTEQLPDLLPEEKEIP